MFAGMYLLGYDIGSSSLKTAIVEAATHWVVSIQSYPETEMNMISRQSDWVEQAPDCCAPRRQHIFPISILCSNIPFFVFLFLYYHLTDGYSV